MKPVALSGLLAFGLLTLSRAGASQSATPTVLKVDDQPLVRHSRLEYNELAQLVDKRLHSVDGGRIWLQSLDYRYHIRGWLTDINNRNLTSNPVPNGQGLDQNYDGPTTTDSRQDMPDLIGPELRYEAPLDGLNTAGEWGGNITSQAWRSRNPLTADPVAR
jgi:hypothetical protein